MLSRHGVRVLDQSLELIVFGKRDDLQHRAELGEDLLQQGETGLEESCTERGRSVTVKRLSVQHLPGAEPPE